MTTTRKVIIAAIFLLGCIAYDFYYKINYTVECHSKGGVAINGIIGFVCIEGKRL